MPLEAPLASLEVGQFQRASASLWRGRDAHATLVPSKNPAGVAHFAFQLDRIRDDVQAEQVVRSKLRQSLHRFQKPPRFPLTRPTGNQRPKLLYIIRPHK